MESIKSELKQVTEQLNSDRALFYSWQSNIAMAFVDECGRHKKKSKLKYLSNSDIHLCANNAAINFLNQLIKESNK